LREETCLGTGPHKPVFGALNMIGLMGCLQ